MKPMFYFSFMRKREKLHIFHLVFMTVLVRVHIVHLTSRFMDLGIFVDGAGKHDGIEPVSIGSFMETTRKRPKSF